MASELKRTHYCGELVKEDIGKDVVVSGFVNKKRNLGSIVFVDLRDRSGIVQISFDEFTDKDVFLNAVELKPEYVLTVKGKLKKRDGEENKSLKTGAFEIFATHLEVISKAKVTPFEICNYNKVSEDIRLKYRYLDLRRKEMQEAIIQRHNILKSTRAYFDQNGFLEIETPTLIKSTPEGARDFLVPSRVNKGEFFALPQSPQIYKQLLMVSGFDRYMQIARCYRDEDLRADRQPEFTQIDLEMSFCDEEDIIKINEGYIKHLFLEVLGKSIDGNFKRLTYEEALNNYGNDKPDLRYNMKIQDLSGIFENTSFNMFKDAAQNGGVRAIVAKNLADKISRKDIDKFTDFVKELGAKGLCYKKITKESTSSNYEKFLEEEEKVNLQKILNLDCNDVAFIICDEKSGIALNCLSELRIKIANKYEIYDKEEFCFVWITDFPMFEYEEEDGRYYAKHHPFTSPKIEDLEKLETFTDKVKARAYDLVLNGVEIGGGSIRITDSKIQKSVFKALGFTDEEVEEKFGFLMGAYNYGSPNHGGMAYGLDRLVMLMLKRTSIRDVIAFPKTQNASELMTGCPSKAQSAQLLDLGIKI